MRFAIRNKDKIAEKLGAETLERIAKSVKLHKGFEPVDSGEKYPVLSVKDTYTEGSISFYVVGGLFDVRILALKEFITTS